MQLNLDIDRAAAPPRDAATILFVRDSEAEGLVVFCVERHKTGFLGGAIVFPGGKVDDPDRDASWRDAVTSPGALRDAFAEDADALRAFGVAACREALEEAALVPLAGGALTHDELLGLRSRIARKKGEPAPQDTLASALREKGLRLDLARLVPFARWITPVAESRRYDTRFFLALCPDGQRGAHDDHETLASFWAPPARVLSRFDAGEIQLAPPTHRSLQILADCARASEALASAERACLLPICPKLVMHEGTLALVLPGDPEHDVKEARTPGRSRYVLRGERWLAEDAPLSSPPRHEA